MTAYGGVGTGIDESMNMFFKRKKPTRISENEDFITLLRVAREDPEVCKSLKAILSLDSFNRRSLLNTWLEQMQFQNAPSELIQALSGLTDDDVAARALKVIEENGL